MYVALGFSLYNTHIDQSHDSTHVLLVRLHVPHVDAFSSCLLS